MSRPDKPPPLVPRRPTTGLALEMRHFRRVFGWSGKQVADAFGVSPSLISRVERGSTRPSRALVQFYEDTFEAGGLLLALYEVAIHGDEQKRQRATRGGRPQPKAVPGDATAFVSHCVPSGTLMKPGQFFSETWTIRNVGTVAWHGRRLERQGPRTGPGLITSPRDVEIPHTEPGKTVNITMPLKAHGYDGSSIAYFKMVDSEGYLCFPDEHQLGLDVLVRVERNLKGTQD